MLPQWHAKEPDHSAKSSGGRLHAYTLEPPKLEWADYAAVKAERWDLSGNELTLNSSGNTRLQSSQLAEPLSTDPGLKSGSSVRELISTLKKKCAGKKGNEWCVAKLRTDNVYLPR